ncbi:PREDICTED: uncharacterized protein LOC104773244 isoform X2 [Camelina sativa]|uniref:Uncharacterized protein LOC104773244 isoform X1 n=1 Tax=Camelina sativa TaxID=90675 RepID=A0ABM0Y644_CAMSA|nr:PREDICTED: uncharacterized protein LOC104773244 isoform X1 [Camelina sativa]XP_019098166.1 PREDICTED: uncharacterized protein LOC104773244 isoform X2 [Camelina sativa]
MDPELEPVALTPQKQDNAWKHCEIYKYGDRLQMRCIYCKKMFKGGGITRVKEHLAGKKGQGTICDQVPEDVRLFLQQCIDGTVRRQRKRQKSSSEPLSVGALPPIEGEMLLLPSDVNDDFKSPGSSDVVVQTESVMSGRTKQRTYRSKKNVFENGSGSNNIDLIGRDMDNLIPVAISSEKNIVHPSFREKENAVHMEIGRFLFGIGADFDAANSVNFQPMIDAIASGGFGVSAPTHDDLRGWILKDCVEEMTKEVDECKAMWKRAGCSLLVEELNSDKGVKVLNFLVYCPEKVVFLKSVEASEIVSSSDKLFELLRELVEEIGSTNVVQVITKCEDHYIDAGTKLMDVYPSLYWAPCAAHCIDQMLEEFGKLGWISETIEQARVITRFIYNRSGVLNLLWKFTSGNDILQPASSTSATNFATLNRIAELKSNLQAMVTSAEWNECSYSEEPSGLVMNTITDEAFWKAVELVNHLTGPLLRALRIVSSEKRPATGYVYAAMYRAKDAIKTHLVNRENYMVYWKIIDRWWEQQQHTPLVAAGFFLNPKFFYNASAEMRSEISLSVLDCFEKLVPDDKIQDKILKELSFYKFGNGVFGRNLAIRARDTMLPAEWWSTYGESCLNLSRFAVRVLSQTCSSSVSSSRRNQIPVEQIYQSTNSIEQKRLSDLVFVQYNMRLRQLGHVSGDETLDPLSHNRMDVLKDWVCRDQACVEGNGSADWKLLESIHRNQVVPIMDDTEDLGPGFDDAEIFKGGKEESDEVYYTNTSEKVFT